MDDNFTFTAPPECPVFRPSKEEFKDPLEYIEKISPIAIKTGICKIIPPDDWRPPFSVNVNTFQFTPRVQKLYELEAQSRIKLNFMTKLSQFVRLQGSDKLKVPNINGRHVDLYKLHKLVHEFGGYEHVTSNKLWPKIGSKMGYKVYSHVYNLKMNYEKIILPYDILLANNNGDNHFFNNSDSKPPKPVLHPSTIKKRKSINVETLDETALQSNEVKKLQFKGAGPKTFTMKEESDVLDSNGLISGPLKRKCLSDIVCKICQSGEQEDRLLICDNELCQDCYHCDCLNPPLTQVPKQSWKCQNCVLKVLNKKPVEYGFPSSSTTYTLFDFGKSADRFKANYFTKQLHELTPCSVVEKEFWRILQSFNDDIIVEYGADIHSSHQGSGFPTFDTIKNGKCARNNGEADWNLAEDYSKEQWNLNILPVHKKSILRFIRGNIDGMKIPWCYVGMVFSSFCWHIEDHWSYSINYLHWGEPKTWYGVSSENADQFESAMRKQAPELFENHEDLLHHITTIMNPNILMKEGVPIYRTDQQAGQFIITFPRAYHAGFNQGFNFAEAVNFCPANWLPKGRACVEHYAQLHRHCVFSHEELLCTIAEASLLEQDSNSTNEINPTKYPLMYGLGLPLNEIQLDTNIRRTVHAELNIVIEIENNIRQKIKQLNIDKWKCTMFESMTDDERACNICQTTCFLSAIQCVCLNDEIKSDATENTDVKDSKIKKIYCLRHIDKLCDICSTDQLTYLYRFTDEEMQKLLSGLEVRLQNFHSWEDEIKKNCTEILLNDCEDIKKWSIDTLQTKLNEGKECGFDSCVQFMRAKGLLERGNNLVSVCKHWLRLLQNPEVTPDPLENVPKSVLIDFLHKDNTVEIRNINVATITEENLSNMSQTISKFPLELPCERFQQMVRRLLIWREESHKLMINAGSIHPTGLLPQVVGLFEEAKSLFSGWAAFTKERTALMLLGKSLQWLIRIRECEESVKSCKSVKSNEDINNFSIPISLVKDKSIQELVRHGELLIKSIRDPNQDLGEIVSKHLYSMCNTLNSALESLYNILTEISKIILDVNNIPKRFISTDTIKVLKSSTSKCLALGVRITEFDEVRLRIYKFGLDIIVNPKPNRFIDLNHALEILELGSSLFNENLLDKADNTLTQKHCGAKTQATLVNRSIRKLKSAYTGCNHEPDSQCNILCNDKDFLKCLLPRCFSANETTNKERHQQYNSEFQSIWISSNPSDEKIVNLMKHYQSYIVDELNSIDEIRASTKLNDKAGDGCLCIICNKQISQQITVSKSLTNLFCSSCSPRSKRPTINEIAQLNKLLKQCPSVVSIFGIALQALSKRTVTWLESLVTLFRVNAPYLSSIYNQVKTQSHLNIPVCIKELFNKPVTTDSNFNGKDSTNKIQEIIENMKYLKRVGYCIEVNVESYIEVISAFIDSIEKTHCPSNKLNSKTTKTLINQLVDQNAACNNNVCMSA